MNRKYKIKVAVLATVIDFGGSEKVVLELLKNLQNYLDFVPIIFTRKDITNIHFFDELEKSGMNYYKIFANKYKFKYYNPIGNIIETHSILRREKFDLVHTHGYRADFLGVIAATLLKLPVISTAHGYIENQMKLKIYKVINGFTYKLFSKIIAVSDDLRHILLKSGVRESKISVIPNAIQPVTDYEKLIKQKKVKRCDLKIKEDEFTVGFIGRLSEEKGLSYLIDAAGKLIQSNYPLKFLIIGDGPQRETLESLVKERQLENNIIFLGFQNDINSWIPALDLFVLPSLTEGTPMALLEVMSFGIPVLASSVGGVPKIILSEKNGLLVKPGRSTELKEAIELLYKDEKRRNKLGKEALKTITKNYSIPDWIQKIEDQYRLLMNGN